ncbi:phage virion morphogenesis protein [uncultured Alistipes sp.]|uniref:phage virion morphogenesis protein n=1 Tax=uncultured Alistipes sp. TaxID=538949 RepID=UPI0025E53011|nr:phage virion morphogenesis protein [uncultured Alistipes sp.]
MKITISEEISSKIEEILEEAPVVIAQVAANYSQDAFRCKAFDRNPWPKNRDPKRRGKELVRSGKLRKSMTVEVKPDRAVISYGNDMVGYAQVHNEGFDGEVTVPAHTRQTRHGAVPVREHTRHAHIPQRQFLGEAQELDELLTEEIDAMVNEILNR